MASVIVVAGVVSAYFALRTPPQQQRAVAGAPEFAPGAAPGAAAQGEGLPTGHPSIELPKEVLEFLDGLAAEAEKNPQDVEAAQKLLRARYRASVINPAYRTSAEQSLQKLLALDPDNAEGLRIAANIAYDAGDYPTAQTRFEAYLAQQPEDASALTDLGSTLLFQDRIDDAIAKYHEAVAKDAKFMQAHFNLGIAFEKQGKRQDAIASLKRAAELAGTPEEKQHIENALAELEGRQPQAIAGSRIPAGGGQAAAGAPPAAPPAAPRAAAGAAPPPSAPGGGMQMPGAMPPAPDRDVPTNASTDFQRAAEKPLVTHPIVGPRVVSFEWTGPASMRVKIADFPMDRMPPFARAKFESSMAEKLAATAAAHGVAGKVAAELVDDASGNVMGTLESAAPAAAPAGAAGSAR